MIVVVADAGASFSAVGGASSRVSVGVGSSIGSGVSSGVIRSSASLRRGTSRTARCSVVGGVRGPASATLLLWAKGAEIETLDLFDVAPHGLHPLVLVIGQALNRTGKLGLNELGSCIAIALEHDLDTAVLEVVLVEERANATPRERAHMH